MLKIVCILLFTLVAFALKGTVTIAFASQNLSSCANQLVSTSLCEELVSQACNESSIPKIEPKQAQSAVIISSPKTPVTPLTVQTEPVAVNLDSDKIFDLINQYRATLGLTPFERENSICELAQVRSIELASELANGSIHSGLYNRNLPYWIWENAKVGSSEEETVSWWIGSPIHRESILGDYKFSCIKCTGSNCTQLFTSFSPK